MIFITFKQIYLISFNIIFFNEIINNNFNQIPNKIQDTPPIDVNKQPRSQQQSQSKPQNQQKNQSQKFPEIHILGSTDIQNLQILERIGFGNGGEVFKVVDNGNTYALKVMSINDLNHQKLQYFVGEYEITNMMNHPNIIKVYGFFFGDSTRPPSILLEYCKTNLEKAIKEKQFSKVTLVKIIYQIVEGMKYIHQQKIIHRDLKPSNILIASDDSIKIADFGISKLMTTEEQSMTQGVGTQKYMAPEVINEDNYNEKADIYSFGVLIFFILSEGKTPVIKMRDIMMGKKAEIPESFTSFAKQLINSCWNFEPQDRPSFNSICEDLRRNNYNLFPLSNDELQQVKEFVKQHEKTIPSYSS